MIVEVIASDVGEGRRGERDAVETMLGQAMTGSFERDGLYAALREIGQRLVQRDRIGRRQRWRDAAIRMRNAECPDGGARSPGGPPDLLGKGRDRRLAVGARDGDDRVRPLAVETSCNASKGPARIVRYDPGDAVRHRVRHMRLAEDDGGALLDSRRDEARAVDMRARKRREKRARPHETAVQGEREHCRIDGGGIYLRKVGQLGQ